MSDRDRLVELIADVQSNGTKWEYGKNYHSVSTIQNSVIADHLLSNGVIVPPCKVGDMVWDRSGDPHKVVSIEWYSKKVVHLHCEHHTFSIGKRSIGKTVFLTREEAENALKERREK